MSDNYVLLLDVGGTWTKIATAENSKIISRRILLTSNFKLEDIKVIIEESGIKFSLVIIACAGPVKDGKCKMTNATHVFDEKSLAYMLGIKVIVINDLEAMAYGLKSEYDSSLIVEIGTGLGVSVISDKGAVIPSEEGHCVIDKEMFLSVPEFRGIIIPEYEYLLSGKNNIMIKLFNKSFVSLNEANNKIISFKKDRFTALYMQTLTSFVDRLLFVHKAENPKRIIFTGGVVSGNEAFMSKFILNLKKKLTKEEKGITEIKIIDDEFLGINGTLAFYLEKKKEGSIMLESKVTKVTKKQKNL